MSNFTFYFRRTTEGVFQLLFKEGEVCLSLLAVNSGAHCADRETDSLHWQEEQADPDLVSNTNLPQHNATGLYGS